MNLKDILNVSNLRIDGVKKGKIVKFFDRYYFFPSENLMTTIDNLEIINNADDSKVYLSITAIAKNEAPYLKEWIEYHRLLGVERFYFYDNESNDNTKEILDPYIKKGIVVYHYVKGKAMQIPVYKDAIARYKNNTRWMAIIDLDEFIVPVNSNNLKEFLKDYEKFPALGINWVMFDSNGLINKPDGLVTENYTRINKDYKNEQSANIHIKSIVDPKKVIHVITPHSFIYKNLQFAVNENYKKITKYPFALIKHSSEKIRINHYYSKSLEEYKARVLKGKADADTAKDFIESYINFKATIPDERILRFLPELKERINEIKN